MTIDEAGAALGIDHDLIAHMREVHAQAADASSGASADVSGSSGRTTGSTPIERIEEVDAEDPVQRRLLETAQGALDGDFDGDVHAVRATVVDEIFDEQWKERLPADRRESIGGVVREALAGDLAFRTEVDHMLLHAARLLGRAGS
jgi:hypothetical protein